MSVKELAHIKEFIENTSHMDTNSPRNSAETSEESLDIPELLIKAEEFFLVR
jgi:hypothetical protein